MRSEEHSGQYHGATICRDIATLPAYFKAGHMTQFIGLLISIAVAFVLGTVLTMIVGSEVVLLITNQTMYQQ